MFHKTKHIRWRVEFQDHRRDTDKSFSKIYCKFMQFNIDVCYRRDDVGIGCISGYRHGRY